MTERQIARWQREHDNFASGIISKYKRSKYGNDIALANEFCGRVNLLLTHGKVLYLARLAQGYSWKDKRRAVFAWLVVKSDCGGYLCFNEQPERLPLRSAKQVAREINGKFEGKTFAL